MSSLLFCEWFRSEICVPLIVAQNDMAAAIVCQAGIERSRDRVRRKSVRKIGVEPDRRVDTMTRINPQEGSTDEDSNNRGNNSCRPGDYFLRESGH
jgi:hypothetical protein